jgi:hypothetical protein
MKSRRVDDLNVSLHQGRSPQEPPRQDGQAELPAPTPGQESNGRVATVILTSRIENNSKFVRGKKRAREHIERGGLQEYKPALLATGDYELKVPNGADDGLDETRDELLGDIAITFDVDVDLHPKNTDPIKGVAIIYGYGIARQIPGWPVSPS